MDSQGVFKNHPKNVNRFHKTSFIQKLFMLVIVQNILLTYDKLKICVIIFVIRILN